MTTTRPTLLHTGDSGHHVDILDAVQERNRPLARFSYTRFWWRAAAGLTAVAGIWAGVAGLRAPTRAAAAEERTSASASRTPDWQSAATRDTVAPTERIAHAPDPPPTPIAATAPLPVQAHEPLISAAAAASPAAQIKSEAEAAVATVTGEDLGEPRVVPHKNSVSRPTHAGSKRDAPARAPVAPPPHPPGQARSQASTESKDADVELLSALMKHMRNANVSDTTTRTAVEPVAKCRAGTNQDARCSPRATAR